MRSGTADDFSIDLIAGIGGMFRYEDLECEVRDVAGAQVRIATPETVALRPSGPPPALPLFQSFLSIAGLEIVPIPAGKDLAPLAGLTDAKDLPVLASAIAGQADVLVTGDEKDLLRIRKGALPFPILSAADFLDSYLPRFLKSGF